MIFMGLPLVSFILGSREVAHTQSHCSASMNAGKPKTTSSFPAQPSGVLPMLQWVAIWSGRRFHSSRPTTMGIKITREAAIMVLKYFLISFISFSFYNFCKIIDISSLDY